MFLKLLLSAVMALTLFVGGPAAARDASPDKLVFVFQRQKDPAAIQASADLMAKELGAALGKPVEVMVPGDYSASVQALVSGRADFAYLSSLPFLLARRDGGAKLLLAEERSDVTTGRPRTDYDAIIVVHKDSPLKTWDDFVANAKNLRFSFTSPTSTSGYVMPLAYFIQQGLMAKGQKPETFFAEASYGGGYTQALTQVLKKRADVAAVSDYVMDGPKADVYLTAQERAELRVLKRIPGVPTHLIAVRGDLDRQIIDKARQTLMALSQTRPELVSDVYGARALVTVDENTHVAGTIAAIEATGLPIEGLAK